ncbi:MAG: DUF4157 domain-containing protein, partial [Cyanobacteria bacterium J06559_3]
MTTHTQSQPQTASNWSPPTNQLEGQSPATAEASQTASHPLQARPFVLPPPPTSGGPADIQAKPENLQESLIDLTKVNLFAGSPPPPTGKADSGPDSVIQAKSAASETEALQAAAAPVKRGSGPVTLQDLLGAHNPVVKQKPSGSSTATPSYKPSAINLTTLTLPNSATAAVPPSLQRQTTPSIEASTDVDRAIARSRGQGQPLTDSVRGPMEQAFGANFSGVRIHTDSQADGLNQSLQAKAFTTGQDIYFKQGEFKPGSRTGQELLAHELTHTIQQTGGTRAQAKSNRIQTKWSRSLLPSLVPLNYIQLKRSPEELSETTSDTDETQLENRQTGIETQLSRLNKLSSVSSQVSAVDEQPVSDEQAIQSGQSLESSETTDVQGNGSASKQPSIATSENVGESREALPEAAAINNAVSDASSIEEVNSSTTTSESLPEAKVPENVPNAGSVEAGSSSSSTAVSSESIGGTSSQASGPTSSQAAVSLSTENPSQIIEQLITIPPTQLPATYAQASDASAQALEDQRQQLQDNLPEMPAPTGLSAATTKNTKPSQIAQQAAEQAASDGKEPAIEIEGSGASSVPVAAQIQVPEAPAALPQPPTQLAGAEKPAEGESDTALSQSAQHALNSISTDTSPINTSLGDRPQVDLTGDANPSQMETAKAASTQEVQSAKATAAQAINQDFGENAIYPQASDEILKPNKELAAIPPGAAQAKEATAGVPGEVAGSLNQSLTPYLREQIGPEQEKYRAGKEKFDTDTTQARTKADEDIAALNEATQQEQRQEQQTAQAEVAQAKQEWRDELKAVEQDYQDKASKATTDQRKKIDDEKAK